MSTLMGGTVPSSNDADAGFGVSPLIAPADARGPDDFFFLGL
jgi:hypothetical protein